jgi:hypothetical protein
MLSIPTPEKELIMQSGFTKLTLLGVALLGVSSLAQARPPFAKKEGVACDYCHSGQQPKRNYRGVFYGANDHTFNGFDDKAEAEKAGAEIGPAADSKPASLVAPKKAEPTPAPAPTPTPAPALPKPNIPVLKAKVGEWLAKYKKSPKPNAKGYAQALANLGHGQMLDSTVRPAMRYPMALATLRSALKVDPANALAKADVKQIEEAYKALGRPIPK